MGARNLSKTQVYESMMHEELRKHLNWERIAIHERISDSEVIKQAIDQKVTHICQTSHPHFIDDLNVSALIMGRPELFHEFPISSILTPQTASSASEQEKIIFEVLFSKASQKGDILTGVEQALTRLSASSSIIADTVIIADELCTNAVYNAPFVDLANTLPGASRTAVNVEMSEGKMARIFLGADKKRIVIGCVDTYGTLNLPKLFTRIEKCYDRGVGESMNMSGGGAGIGSFMVFNSAASYFAAVEIGKKTMICCALPLKISNRARLELPKNMHYIFNK